MSDNGAPPRRRLRERTAEEIRVILARRRLSAAELARRTGIKQSTMARRMTGETAFDLDDLEVIAAALGVKVTELLGGEGVQATGAKLRASNVPVSRPERTTPERPKDNRPTGRPTRPKSSPSTRRPVRL